MVRVSTTDRIHEALREGILSGELASGSLHSIYQLAERFGVSRTPVRDAVLRLADTGMLTIERNHGVRVRGLRVKDIRDVFDVRLLLEVPATARAAANATPELVAALQECLRSLEAAASASDFSSFMREDRHLHSLLMQAGGNERLAAIVESLRDATQARGVSTADHSRSLQQIQHEHVPIVDAVQRGDSDAAARVMSAHLIETGRLLMRQVAALSGEETPEGWPAL